MAILFRRAKDQPIITIHDLDFRAAAVLNPGAAEHGDEVVLLLRVEDTTGRSNLHVARSRNGVDNWRIEHEPLLRYGESRFPYELWGCEDARITYLVEEQAWYITYTAASPFGSTVGLARTEDFASADRLGLVFPPNNKDAVLFPQRCGDCYFMLHRPDAGGIANIWSSCSSDLVHWGMPACVLPEGAGPSWDAVKVGAGPPPLLTEHGWLQIYHGVKGYGGLLKYRAGVAILDRDDPTKLVARCPHWVFQAQTSYEQAGIVPGIVFPTGLLRRGDELWMYYGAADTCIGLAIAPLDDVLDVVLNHY